MLALLLPPPACAACSRCCPSVSQGKGSELNKRGGGGEGASAEKARAPPPSPPPPPATSALDTCSSASTTTIQAEPNCPPVLWHTLSSAHSAESCLAEAPSLPSPLLLASSAGAGLADAMPPLPRLHLLRFSNASPLLLLPLLPASSAGGMHSVAASEATLAVGRQCATPPHASCESRTRAKSRPRARSSAPSAASRL